MSIVRNDLNWPAGRLAALFLCVQQQEGRRETFQHPPHCVFDNYRREYRDRMKFCVERRRVYDPFARTRRFITAKIIVRKFTYILGENQTRMRVSNLVFTWFFYNSFHNHNDDAKPMFASQAKVARPRLRETRVLYKIMDFINVQRIRAILNTNISNSFESRFKH